MASLPKRSEGGKVLPSLLAERFRNGGGAIRMDGTPPRPMETPYAGFDAGGVMPFSRR